MDIDRVFTKFAADQNDPYGEIEFVERASKITNADGSVAASMEQLVVPTFWSQVARINLLKINQKLDSKNKKETCNIKTTSSV